MGLTKKVLIAAGLVSLVGIGDVMGYTFRAVKDITSMRPVKVEIIYSKKASVVTADGMRYIFSCNRKDSNENCVEYGIETNR